MAEDRAATGAVRLNERFYAHPGDLFECLTHPGRVQAFTQSPAQVLWTYMSRPVCHRTVPCIHVPVVIVTQSATSVDQLVLSHLVLRVFLGAVRRMSLHL